LNQNINSYILKTLIKKQKMNNILLNTDNSLRRYDPYENKCEIKHYPESKPERFLNDFFHVTNIDGYLRHIFSTLYADYLNYDPDQIRDFLFEQFHFQDREAFSNNLWQYVLSTVKNNKASLGKESKEKQDLDVLKVIYISKLVDFFKLFLRAHLLFQVDYDSAEEIEHWKENYDGYYFIDVAFHEFALGKTFNLRATLQYIEQDPNEQYGVQNFIMGVKARNGETYDFEISKENYRKLRKELLRFMGTDFNFKFKVENIPSLSIIQDDHCVKGKILGAV